MARSRSAFLFLALLVVADAARGQSMAWTAPPYWSPPPKTRVENEGLRLNGESALADLPTPPLPLTVIQPCRIADTRGNGFVGQVGPPALSANATRTFPVIGTVPGVPSPCGIPSSAQAVHFQFTAVNTTSRGNLVAWPDGPAPGTSVLNWNPFTEAIGSSTVVALSATGTVNVLLNAPFGTSVDLVIDVNGYYAPHNLVNSVNGLTGEVTLAAGTNVTITPDGQTLTIAAPSAGGAWSLTGNGGTTAGTNFLGTTDNQALELKANGLRAFRIEPNGNAPNMIGGHSGNSAAPGIFGATIAGGGGGIGNRVTASFGTIGGGSQNLAGPTVPALGFDFATVAGGSLNAAKANASTVGGGHFNVALGFGDTIAGGQGNTSSGGVSTICGGAANLATGDYSIACGGFSNYATAVGSTVVGGYENVASGSFSFAAGTRAKAIHDGAFVLSAGLPNVEFESTLPNQFSVRALGGVRFVSGVDGLGQPLVGVHLPQGAGSWATLSDRDSKTNTTPVEARAVLERVSKLNIATWSYRSQDASIRHIGPTAQDFFTAFGVGEDSRHISTVDADGVALAAIQALYELVREKAREIEELKTRLSKIEASSR